jgi:hypothetical protein
MISAGSEGVGSGGAAVLTAEASWKRVAECSGVEEVVTIVASSRRCLTSVR